jgi:hypothetical protein
MPATSNLTTSTTTTTTVTSVPTSEDLKIHRSH